MTEETDFQGQNEQWEQLTSTLRDTSLPRGTFSDLLPVWEELTKETLIQSLRRQRDQPQKGQQNSSRAPLPDPDSKR